MDTKPHIVIIGAGFGGLAAAKEFCTKDMDVTLIDKQNHHLFQPLLYQVAAAALSPSDIAVPVRQLFKNDKHIRTVMAEVRAINSQSQTVTTSVGEVSYDYLVIATGARDNYFGNDQWEQYCHSLKTLHDATTLRSHILRAFEQAENAKSPSDQKRHTTFILVGGGPTGVEMAGSLAELAQLVLAEEFRHADVSKADIILLEGSNKILGGFPDDLSQAALLSLKEKGVDVRLNTRVEDIDADGVTANDTAIDASCVIWCAGVKASPIAKWLDCEISTERDGRVHVSDCLSLPQQDKIYIIGYAAFAFNKDVKSYPGVAP
ncbi:MAG: NAD(P)/FAD-dependent oxidoreductase, partial [Alphaproteobacteria bacterium]|nr:NAD(P)/FAD-dependent oxidoreductase [Alphaproteobacteria bacterium]